MTMDIQWEWPGSLSTTLVVGVVTLLTVWIGQSVWYFSIFRRMGIPGPLPLPVLGNFGPFIKMSMKEVLLKWKKEYGKVYGVFLPQPSLVIGDMELTKEVMVKRFTSFSDRSIFPGFDNGPIKDNLLSIKGDHWKHVRNTLSPTFSSNKLKKILPAITRVANNLCQHLQSKADSRKLVELRDFCRNITMDVIAGVAFGLQVDSLKHPDDQFYRHSEHMVNFTNKMIPVFGIFPSLSRVLGLSALPRADTDYLVGVINAALEERKKDKQKYGDFLQLLVEAEKAGVQGDQVDAEIDFRQQLHTSSQWTRKGLTLGEMHGNSLVFLFAGYETVSTIMSLTLFALAANQECLRKAREETDKKVGKGTLDYDSIMELTYIDMCMNESMRLYLNQFVDRAATEDCDLGGYHVTKGMRIILPSLVFHHDPKEWPDPETFDPERHTPEARAARHPFSFMPFGLGPRNCIGMRLAQVEIRMIIASILQKYTPVLCEKSVFPPVFKPMSLVSCDGLWVRFQPREDDH